MCEFCTKHGEGKKWYLQMKNYSRELLLEELSAAQQGIVGAKTRFEWNNLFLESFVMPAVGAVSIPQAETANAEPTPAQSPLSSSAL